MKILIIGGTKFLGRHLAAAAALERGHEVTLFNRGTHYSGAVENVEQIHGDRNRDLDKLKGRSWDAVIDTCGYLPQTVKASAEALKDLAGLYVFISSISAYADFSRPNFDENAPLSVLTEEQSARAGEIYPEGELNAFLLGDLYGGLKALCERETEKAMAAAAAAGRTLIIRPGLIVGSHDTTDRFTYWVTRVAAGGEVLAPGSPNRFVQLIDARDLSRWIVRMIEDGQSGIYNATGKPFELTMEKMLAEIRAASRSDADFVWADEDFLRRENVAAWSEMPLYLPESYERTQGFLSANIDRALQKGLVFRPLKETIQDVLNWRGTKNDELKAGIGIEKERQLLRKWCEQ